MTVTLPAGQAPGKYTITVTIPAGINSFVDVCINTRVFGGCQGGSNCCITIVAQGQASGEQGCANSDVTAAHPDHQGCRVLGRGPCDSGLYCETSAPNSNGTFVLEICPFELSGVPGLTLTFWLNMNGASIGQIIVEQIDASGMPLEVIYQNAGDQGSTWFPVTASFTPFGPTAKFRFLYQAGGSFTGDIAVDEIFPQ